MDGDGSGLSFPLSPLEPEHAATTPASIATQAMRAYERLKFFIKVQCSKILYLNYLATMTLGTLRHPT